MTEGQRRSAVARKRAAANVGPKPTNVKTVLKRQSGGMGDGPPIRTSKLGFGLMTYKKDPKPVKYGDAILKAIEDNKMEIDPNITYSKIYKNNIQVDLGLSKKGKGILELKKIWRYKIMALSGSTSFNLNIDEIIDGRYERCGLRPMAGYDLKTARRSLNLLFADWGNRGIHLWKVQLNEQALTAGTATYTVPANVNDVLEAYISTTAAASDGPSTQMYH